MQTKQDPESEVTSWRDGLARLRRTSDLPRVHDLTASIIDRYETLAFDYAELELMAGEYQGGQDAKQHEVAHLRGRRGHRGGAA